MPESSTFNQDVKSLKGITNPDLEVYYTDSLL